MKKLLIFLTFIFIFFNAQAALWAKDVHKILIMPIDTPVQGSSFSIYPEVISLISADISNVLSRDTNLEIINTITAERILVRAGLYKKYRSFLKNYKTRYVLDNDLMDEIAEATGATQVLFVSGGFDTSSMVLKERGIDFFNDFPLFGAFKKCFWGTREISPFYKLNILTTLIDPYKGVKIWESAYNDEFRVEDFNVPSQYFGENTKPVEEIKKFSSDVAYSTARAIYHTAKSYPVKTVIAKQKEIVNEDSTTEGSVTKDGHFFHVNRINYIKNKKKKEFIDWIKNQ